jgi:hypothetical protein
MLFVAAVLKGYEIEATDGHIGTVRDFLFDDTSWTLRWLVVDNSTWLTERKLLLHPSAIGTADHKLRALRVALSKAQIEASPDIRHELPISRRMELSLYDYYGASPLWEGRGYFGGGAIASPLSFPPLFGQTPMDEPDANVLDTDGRDPHLRSVAAVAGYQVHAEDGMIGHVENFLIDDIRWDIRYVIIDTKNFWPGKHVLLSTHAVTGIDGVRREFRLNLSCETVKTSPEWNPTDVIDAEFERRLHTHYNWPASSYY